MLQTILFSAYSLFNDYFSRSKNDFIAVNNLFTASSVLFSDSSRSNYN